MSFNGIAALRPQMFKDESQWSQYFSRAIDRCTSTQEVDFIYSHWANCINSQKYELLP
jgi:alkyl sulfatase BDS1-like metallo-beta-lactamase superfamily hydrolase